MAPDARNRARVCAAFPGYGICFASFPDGARDMLRPLHFSAYLGGVVHGPCAAFSGLPIAHSVYTRVENAWDVGYLFLL